MRTKNINIDVHHLTRVEGHGNIKVNITDGNIKQVVWQVPESPRFFEAMVRGRHYSEVARITSRICGICSIGHSLASVKATENALGIVVTSQTEKLRRILKHAENFDSNLLHVYFLAAPDLLGVSSVFPLVKTHGEVVARALRLKRLGHEWGSIIGGRTTHPTTVVPGGFSKIPTRQDLINLKEKLLSAEEDLNATIETLLSISSNIPEFYRETEYMSLKGESQYELYDGEVQTVMPDGFKETYQVADYLSITNEYLTDNSTAKYAKNKLDSYMAGALARFNNNYNLLHCNAKQVAEKLGIVAPCFNPYFNTVAQAVEVVNDVYKTVDLIDDLLEVGLVSEKLVMPSKFDKGVSAVEVPRGILFHEYKYDKHGYCQEGNCVIPTNQNHANIQLDFEKLVPELLEKDYTEDEMRLALEMLVRAYDPCISCSTHYLDVEFIK